MPTTERKSFQPLGARADSPGAISVRFASLNQIDADGDVTLPGAFGNQTVRIQSHGHATSTWTIGKGVIREEGDAAIMDGLLNLDMPEGRNAHASLKFDLEKGEPLQQWSYVFQIEDADFGQYQGQTVRFLKRLKVHSVDPVFLGAGVGTATLAVKGIDTSTAEELTSSEKATLEIIREKWRFEQIKASLQPCYVVVNEQDIDDRTIKACNYLLDVLSMQLPSNEPPELKWFRQATFEEREELQTRGAHSVKRVPWRTEKRLTGRTAKDGIIWVSSDFENPWQPVLVAAHELAHLSRLQKLSDPKRWTVEKMSDAQEEDFCDEFAQRVVTAHEDDLAQIIEG